MYGEPLGHIATAVFRKFALKRFPGADQDDMEIRAISNRGYCATDRHSGPPVATHGVKGYPHEQSTYLISSSSWMTLRPLYMPQPPQRRWGIFGSPHSPQAPMLGLVRKSWARRCLVREWECLLLGKAMVVPPSHPPLRRRYTVGPPRTDGYLFLGCSELFQLL